jgi:hypothetical protein
MKLSPREIRLAIYALRSTVAQFAGKDDFHPEDWVTEQKEQRETRRLLKKLENQLSLHVAQSKTEAA